MHSGRFVETAIRRNIVRFSGGTAWENVRIIQVKNADELRRCLKIREAVFMVEKGVPKEIEVDEHDRLGGRCGHFLIQYRQKDAGTIRCLDTAEKTICIQRFCFLKEFRNLGLGRTTLKFMEDHYKRKGKTTVELNAKYEACGFYEKCGYKKVSGVFMEAGVRHVAMMKTL